MAWLSVNETARCASFAYTSWLGAGAQRELVQESLARWLSVHGRERTVGVVLDWWLRAGGEPDMFAEHVEKWLSAHTETSRRRTTFIAGGSNTVVRFRYSPVLYGSGLRLARVWSAQVRCARRG